MQLNTKRLYCIGNQCFFVIVIVYFFVIANSLMLICMYSQYLRSCPESILGEQYYAFYVVVIYLLVICHLLCHCIFFAGSENSDYILQVVLIPLGIKNT